MANKPHLSNLFNAGEEVVIEDGVGNEYVLWVQRPTSLQQEAARVKANGRSARIKADSLEVGSDRHIALKQSFDDITDVGELIDARLQYDEVELREQAYNVVLYGDEGADWNEGNEYFDLIEAISQRVDEIRKYNASMEEAGSDERIKDEEDEELAGLYERQSEFTTQTVEVLDGMVADRRAELEAKSVDEIKAESIEMAVNLESQMFWYEEYQNRMLYFACRYPEDHKKFYFKDPDDVQELPQWAKTMLFEAYERIDRGAGDLKNLPSLPSS